MSPADWTRGTYTAPWRSQNRIDLGANGSVATRQRETCLASSAVLHAQCYPQIRSCLGILHLGHRIRDPSRFQCIRPALAISSRIETDPPQDKILRIDGDGIHRSVRAHVHSLSGATVPPTQTRPCTKQHGGFGVGCVMWYRDGIRPARTRRPGG